jgi:hypothetical protein
MSLEDNILKFRPRQSSKGLDTFKEPTLMPSGELDDPEERCLYEMLGQVEDPDERLLLFTHICLKYPDMEQLDKLYDEARARIFRSIEPNHTPAAWYAISAYSFLNDLPRRYTALEKMLRYAGENTNYTFFGLELIVREDRYNEKGLELAERLTADLLERKADDECLMDWVRYAHEYVLHLPKEESDRRIAFAKERARFRR